MNNLNKRNLIYIANARFPSEHAHSVQIIKMCEAFSQMGWVVRLYAPYRFNTIKQSVWEYYRVSPVFKIKRIISLDLIQFAFLGKLSFWISSVSFSIFTWLYLLFKDTDVIYSRDLLSIIGISLFKKNCIFEMHSRYSGWGVKFLGRVNKIIVISRGLKDELVKKGVSANKILVAADGVDLNIFDNIGDKNDCRKVLNVSTDALILGYVGQLKTMGMDKGIGLLLSVIKKLQIKRPNLHLYLVGGWPFHVKEYIGEAGENVHFVGQVPYRVVPEYLKSFDALIMPFPSNPHYMRDMSPLKMFEYMAAERPIISSDLPAIREVLDNDSAFFFEPENDDSLIKVLENVFDNLEDAALKASAARLKVEEFTWKKRADKISDFILMYEF